MKLCSQLVGLSLLVVAAECFTVQIRLAETEESTNDRRVCEQASLCFSTDPWHLIQVSESDSWLAIVRQMCAALRIRSWFATKVWVEGTGQALRSKQALRHGQRLFINSRLPLLEAFAMGNIGPMWETKYDSAVQ